LLLADFWLSKAAVLNSYHEKAARLLTHRVQHGSETTEKERQDLENHPFFDDHPGADPML
jgi:hypothetical protein